MRWILLGLALLLAAATGVLLAWPHSGGRQGAPAAGGRARPRPASSGPDRVRSASAGPVACAADPAACGFPDAADTGVPAGTVLRAVPGQVSSGPGWAWVAADREVDVTGNGSSLRGLEIHGTLSVLAAGVTIDDVAVRPAPGAPYGIGLRHATDVTIEDTSVTGSDSRAGRVGVAICDVSGTSVGTVISHDDIADFRTAIQMSTGQIAGNYIHDPGYLPGDHTNGILDLGTTQPLTIIRNTILISLGQTDAISLDATAGGQPVANKTIVGNLLAGGSYTIYGGTSHGNITRNIRISGNIFSQQFFPSSGRFGAAAYFAAGGSGNIWAGNTWGTTGESISPGTGTGTGTVVGAGAGEVVAGATDHAS
jgi:Right handed beta helix region